MMDPTTAATSTEGFPETSSDRFRWLPGGERDVPTSDSGRCDLCRILQKFDRLQDRVQLFERLQNGLPG